MSRARTSFGVHLVGFGGEPERHPQEVLHQRERVVRVEERLTDRLLVRVGRDRRQLGQQPDGGEFHLGVVERVERILVVGRQRVGCAGQHRHRMRVAREAVEEPLQVLVQQRVPLDLGGELLQLFLGRQFAVDQQITDLDEIRLLRELLDRVAAIAQDAGVAVDVGDGALGGGGVDESAVEGGVAGLGQQRTQRDTVGALSRVDDVQVKLTPGYLRVASPLLSATGIPSSQLRVDSALQKVVPFGAFVPAWGVEDSDGAVGPPPSGLSTRDLRHHRDSRRFRHRPLEPVTTGAVPSIGHEHAMHSVTHGDQLGNRRWRRGGGHRLEALAFDVDVRQQPVDPARQIPRLLP